MKKKVELIKNTFIIFLGKVSTQFMSFILLPLYTYKLNTSEYGMYDMLITYINLIVIFLTLQLEQALFRFLIDKRGNKIESTRIISNIYIMILIQIIIFSIIMIFFNYIIKIEYSFLFSILVVITALNLTILQLARGFGENILYSKASALNGITIIILNVIFLIFLNFKIPGLLFANFIANSISFIYLFFKLKLYKYFKKNAFNKKDSITYLRYSIPLIPNIVSWWIINVSDRTIITYFLNAAANGIYAVSNKFPMVISSLYSIFNMSWTESISLHINDSDAKIYIKSVINTAFNLSAVICAFIIIIAPSVIFLCIDKSFYESIQYIPILMLGSLFNIVIGLYSAIYIAYKFTKQIMNTSIIAAIINISVNVLLIRFIGLYAAAISTTFAYFVMMIYRYYDVKKIIKIDIYKKNILMAAIMYIYLFIDFYFMHNKVYINLLFLLIYILFCFKKYVIYILRKVKK